MKVVTVLGSPRLKGNTARVLGWVEEALRADGHQIERFDLSHYVVRGCLGCNACQTDQATPSCGQDDDGNLILATMQAADAFVLASPLYCWGFSSQLKALLDRNYCMVKWVDGQPLCLLEGRRGALLMTAAGPVEDNLDLVLRPWQKILEYLRVVDAGQLLVPFCSSPDKLGDEVRRRAAELAGQVTGRVELVG